MARKGITISLAAKCQLLFGLAVLVIIAGALAVPWQRMEQLAGQPNIKAARFAADLLFRQAHTPHGAALARVPATEPATHLAPATTDSWNDITLTDTDYPRPSIIKVPIPGAELTPSAVGDDPFALQALRQFRSRTAETEYGRVVMLADKSRAYRFAQAVRLEASCLKCHGEYVSWVKPHVSAPASASAPAPASRPASSVVASTLQPSAETQSATTRAAATRPATTRSATTRPAEAPKIATIWPLVAVIRVDVPYQTDENQLLLNRIVIVVSGMLGGTLAIVVFYLITSRLILQPVRVLKNTAEKVSKGDLNIRSAISTGDEFQQLSETFNNMLITLSSSQTQLEATNRSLDTRVGELAQSNVDLYEANRLKSEFLTNVTHELRTPLNAIIGFADLLASLAGDPKQERYVENIKISARQLLELINDLLDLAKIEAGKLVLREEKVNVADVCEAMANFMRPLAQKKNIELDLALMADMPLITTDPGRFQQILYNFLSNAVKFTPNEGRITIAARNESAPPPEPSASPATRLPDPGLAVPTIRVSVIDSGPGISAEDQKLIFEKFRQIDGSVTRQHSGTGLGLAISKELANMLGAKIELVSVVGKGATFSILIPQANPHHTIEVHPELENR